MKLPKVYKLVIQNVKKADPDALSRLIQYCFKVDEDVAQRMVSQGQKSLKIEFSGYPFEIAELLDHKAKELNKKFKMDLKFFLEEDKEETNG